MPLFRLSAGISSGFFILSCSIISAATVYPQQSGAQFGGYQGRGSGGRPAGRPSGRGFAHPSTSQQAGHGQARFFTLTPQDAQTSDAVVAGILSLCFFCETRVLFNPGASHSLFHLVLLLN